MFVCFLDTNPKATPLIFTMLSSYHLRQLSTFFELLIRQETLVMRLLFDLCYRYCKLSMSTEVLHMYVVVFFFSLFILNRFWQVFGLKRSCIFRSAVTPFLFFFQYIYTYFLYINICWSINIYKYIYKR